MLINYFDIESIVRSEFFPNCELTSFLIMAMCHVTSDLRVFDTIPKIERNLTQQLEILSIMESMLG